MLAGGCECALRSGGQRLRAGRLLREAILENSNQASAGGRRRACATCTAAAAGPSAYPTQRHWHWSGVALALVRRGTGTGPAWHGTGPAWYGTGPAWHGTGPAWHGTGPSTYPSQGTASAHHCTYAHARSEVATHGPGATHARAGSDSRTRAHLCKCVNERMASLTRARTSQDSDKPRPHMRRPSTRLSARHRCGTEHIAVGQ